MKLKCASSCIKFMQHAGREKNTGRQRSVCHSDKLGTNQICSWKHRHKWIDLYFSSVEFNASLQKAISRAGINLVSIFFKTETLTCSFCEIVNFHRLRLYSFSKWLCCSVLCAAVLPMYGGMCMPTSTRVFDSRALASLTAFQWFIWWPSSYDCLSVGLSMAFLWSFNRLSVAFP